MDDSINQPKVHTPPPTPREIVGSEKPRKVDLSPKSLALAEKKYETVEDVINRSVRPKTRSTEKPKSLGTGKESRSHKFTPIDMKKYHDMAARIQKIARGES